MKSIRGTTIKRVGGLLTIRTETGTEMVIENKELPLYVSVLIYYDYSRGRIRDVVENKILPDTEDLINYREVDEDDGELYLEDKPSADGETLLNTFHNDHDISEDPHLTDEWD